MRRGRAGGGPRACLVAFAAALLGAMVPAGAQSLSVRPDPLRPGVLFIGADPAGSLDSPFTVLVSSNDGVLQSVPARAFERNAVNICTVLREHGQATRARTLSVFVQRGMATRTARLSYDGRSCGSADNPGHGRAPAETGDGLDLEEIRAPQRSAAAPSAAGKSILPPETFRPEVPAARQQAPAAAATPVVAAAPAPAAPPKAQPPSPSEPSAQAGAIDMDAIEGEELISGGSGSQGSQWKLILRFRRNLPGGLSRGRVLRAVSGMTGSTVLVRKPFEVPLEVDARARRITLALPPERLESPLVADELVSFDLEIGGRMLQVRVLAGAGGGE